MYREAFLKFTQLIEFISSLAIAHDNENVENSILEFDFLPGFITNLKNEPRESILKASPHPASSLLPPSSHNHAEQTHTFEKK